MAKGKKRPAELPEYGTVMMKGVALAVGNVLALVRHIHGAEYPRQALLLHGPAIIPVNAGSYFILLFPL